ncbi:MAG: 5-formyltetrahydrofolate cyclo-ligase [Kiritimatiellia bacterium]|jgi:5-formyltetrahydrofolate cyclo-ligase|nr:5-formyltetrahydrofolate cyclo-ligase [Kiritimatiellia bacterium]MDP6630681.1 5-formyltetrahydrofolate cyclo-ligase [Kiritimatiellia bacterium]MDP6809456.1 5-formyltetrahydrofolate cyclo-ligase [Kiritimatiellia bacterium]MDP7023867.1 5-formyltetrahydrofolate cyclo-ligase [Kiritimatiellia bacterium]
MSDPMTKDDVRQMVRGRRDGLDPAWRAEQSTRLQERLMALPAMRAAALVGLYMPLPGEVEMAECEEMLANSGRGICVPAFDPARGGYSMAIVSSSTQYMDAPFGLREPEDPVWADPASIECIVVPGVAFDQACRRLGHGGGHYDRMLAEMTASKVGVAFDFQVFDEVPHDAHDVAMDLVVTPTHTIRPRPVSG